MTYDIHRGSLGAIVSIDSGTAVWSQRMGRKTSCVLHMYACVRVLRVMRRIYIYTCIYMTFIAVAGLPILHM